jgi:hypothetical protein
MTCFSWTLSPHLQKERGGNSTGDPHWGGVYTPLELLVTPRCKRLGLTHECRKILGLFGQFDYMGL